MSGSTASSLAGGGSPAAGDPDPTAVRFDAVSRVHPGKTGDTHALRGVSLEIGRGRVSGVIGHSGAGKSTLIRMINGLDQPTSGTVHVDGVDVASLRGDALRAAQKATGMVFQQFQLLETLTVRDNVSMPLRLDGARKRQTRDRVDEVLEFVGLAEMSERYPGQLSGGQKQRVGIARAIVRNPRILLCDEATSALDPETTGQVIELLRRINGEYGTTIVVVTHEMDVIKDLCDDVAVMAEGRIVERGSVLDVFVRPQTAVARAFVGTVVPQDVPDRVIARLGETNLWRLLLLDGQVTEPIMSTLITRFGVAVNILHADMTEVQRHTVGQMIVHVDGDPTSVAAARAYVEENVVDVQDVVKA